jgi:hypothetical protein
MSRIGNDTHHLLAKKVESLKGAHGLCTGLDVLEDYMGLASHFVRFHSHDVEDGAIGRE